MLKDVAEKYYFSENYNCAEAIIRAANEYYDLGLHERDMIMMAGYGAGMQSGKTCGALLSTIAVVALKVVETRAHESKDLQPLTFQLTKNFNERLGSILCCEIRPKFFSREYRCRDTVFAACDVLEETLAEYTPR